MFVGMRVNHRVCFFPLSHACIRDQQYSLLQATFKRFPTDLALRLLDSLDKNVKKGERRGDIVSFLPCILILCQKPAPTLPTMQLWLEIQACYVGNC